MEIFEGLQNGLPPPVDNRLLVLIATAFGRPMAFIVTVGATER